MPSSPFPLSFPIQSVAGTPPTLLLCSAAAGRMARHRSQPPSPSCRPPWTLLASLMLTKPVALAGDHWNRRCHGCLRLLSLAAAANLAADRGNRITLTPRSQNWRPLVQNRVLHRRRHEDFGQLLCREREEEEKNRIFPIEK